MTTHTPKPWKAGLTAGVPNGNILAGIGQNGEDWIAAVKPFSDQFHANIRLIAAAPDLLVACEAIVHASKLNDPALGGVAATLAEIAISKAEGATGE